MAAAGGVQQRAWREGEQAQRHTEPRQTSSGEEKQSGGGSDHEGLVALMVWGKYWGEQTRGRRMSWC